VTIDDLKRAKDERPFRPFKINLADGRALEVRHPDAVAWDISLDEDDEPEEPRTAVCVVPGGGWEVVDLDLITSLGFYPAPSKGKSKGKGAK
jgi:hypothetical protein